jgi:GBP family porin
MKKTLVAIAALAAATGAMAQSSVTLYGNLDQSVYRATQDGKSALSSASNGGSTSLWGMTGKESLGNGLTAEFDLKSEITLMSGQASSSGSTATKTSDVSNAQSTLFNRGAWIGLSDTKYGNVKLGRQNDALWEQAGRFNNTGINSFGWNNLTAAATSFSTTAASNTFQGTAVGLTTNNFMGSNLTGSINQSASGSGLAFVGGISYETATYSGIKGKIFSSAKTTYANGINEGRRTSASLTYDQGPVAVAYGVSNLNDGLGGEGAKVTLLAASYTMGALKFNAGQQKTTFDGAWVAAHDMTVNGYGVGYTQGAWEYNLGYTELKDNEDSANKTKQTGLTARLNLSKRTSVYAGYGTSKNTGTSKVGVVYGGAAMATAGVTNNAILVGMKHGF